MVQLSWYVAKVNRRKIMTVGNVDTTYRNFMGYFNRNYNNFQIRIIVYLLS